MYVGARNEGTFGTANIALQGVRVRVSWPVVRGAMWGSGSGSGGGGSGGGGRRGGGGSADALVGSGVGAPVVSLWDDEANADVEGDDAELDGDDADGDANPDADADLGFGTGLGGFGAAADSDYQRREDPTRLHTFGDAYDLCKARIDAQLEMAEGLRPAPNVAIAGDASSRAAFLTLLPDGMQRKLFMETASNRASWPRIRTLFGSPPFHFLKPQDAFVLNASGFARGRARMSYETEGRTASVAQFAGQFIDVSLREYRIAPIHVQESDLLPGEVAFRSAGEVMLQVKIRKRSRKLKQEMLRSADTRDRLFFPRQGDSVELRETPRMRNLRGLRQSSRTRCIVRAIAPRERGASTAALLVRVVA